MTRMPNQSLAARHPTDRNVVVDGGDYCFSMKLAGRGTMSAAIWSPSEGKTSALVALGETLGDYARGQADEATLISASKPLN
jgi:hypothetical protein